VKLVLPPSGRCVELRPERQQFPISVCSRHTAAWLRTRRAFFAGLLLGSTFWVIVIWIQALCS
jgi:hypothetical protein